MTCKLAKAHLSCTSKLSATRATVRLVRGGKTVVRASGRVRAGKLPAVDAHKLRKGRRYTLVVRLTGKGKTRTVKRSLKL